MKVCKLILFVLGITCFPCLSLLSGQADVIIDDSLLVHAEILEVDVKNVTGRSREFNMGNYTIFADEEWSNTTRKTKEKLTGARVVTDVVSTFAFTITGGGADTLEVFAEDKFRINTYYPNEILENFILEESTSTKQISFAAWIQIKGDTNTTWTLYVPKTRGKKDKLNFEMLLSDGKKFINISPVSSDPYFNYNHPMWGLLKGTALGVEFIDDGKFICAVQYTPETKGFLHLADNYAYPGKVWMHKDLDECTKLVLAASMSTLLLMNNSYLAMPSE